MLITDTLDVGIGLALVYLLVSIVMTALSEGIEGLLKKRAVDLERAIAGIFQGNADALTDFYRHPLVFALYQDEYKAVANDGRAAGRWLGRNLPSYIPREIFSAVVLDMRRLGSPYLTGPLGQALDGLASSGGFDPSALRREIEGWFDASMDRASGWYRRRTQNRLFLLGLFVAVAANVNSVTIANYLARVPEARKATVEIATQAVRKAPGWTGPAEKIIDRQNDGGDASSPDNAASAADGDNAIVDALAAGGGAVAGNAGEAAIDDAMGATPGSGNGADPVTNDQEAFAEDYATQLAKIGLPIGWSKESEKQLVSDFPRDRGMRWFGAAALLVIGYLVTALAIMLGSPFWFDVLDRLIVVRSTVKPTEKSPDEASKDKTGSDPPSSTNVVVPAGVAGAAGGPAGPSTLEPLIYG